MCCIQHTEAPITISNTSSAQTSWINIWIMESFGVAAVKKKQAMETKVKVAAAAASLTGLCKFACICLFSHLLPIRFADGAFF